jgi:hypothetical protein
VAGEAGATTPTGRVLFSEIREGSIAAAMDGRNMVIWKTHTPSEKITIDGADLRDFKAVVQRMVALEEDKRAGAGSAAQARAPAPRPPIEAVIREALAGTTPPGPVLVSERDFWAMCARLGARVYKATGNTEYMLLPLPGDGVTVRVEPRDDVEEGRFVSDSAGLPTGKSASFAAAADGHAIGMSVEPDDGPPSPDGRLHGVFAAQDAARLRQEHGQRAGLDSGIALDLTRQSAIGETFDKAGVTVEINRTHGNVVLVASGSGGAIGLRDADGRRRVLIDDSGRWALGRFAGRENDAADAKILERREQEPAARDVKQDGRDRKKAATLDGVAQQLLDLASFRAGLRDHEAVTALVDAYVRLRSAP